MKRFLTVILALVFVVALAVPAYASNLPEHLGTYVKYNKSYIKDGKFYMKFNMKSDYNSIIRVGLYNSRGEKVFGWKDYNLKAKSNIDLSYGTNYINFPSDTYTMKVTAIIKEATGSWHYKINHTQPAYVKLNSYKQVYSDDGNYYTKFVFSHNKCKGKVITYELYNANGKRVYQTASSKGMSSDKGTYFFNWNGYPSNGGLRCKSGYYTVKYWFGGGTPKQTKVYLKID